MRTFILHLQSATRAERVPDVVSFIGEDASGSFGVLAGHERLLTVLGFGLARFRTSDETWHYVAVPGAVVHFVDGELFVASRRYLRGADPERIAGALREELREEEGQIGAAHEALRRLEERMLERLRGLRLESGGLR